jgi:hypothetical protein
LEIVRFLACYCCCFAALEACHAVFSLVCPAISEHRTAVGIGQPRWTCIDIGHRLLNLIFALIKFRSRKNLAMLRRLLLFLGLLAAVWADTDLTDLTSPPQFNAIPTNITAGFSYSLSWTPGDGNVGVEKSRRKPVADANAAC